MEILISASQYMLRSVIFVRLYIQLNGYVLKAIAGRFMSSMLVGT